MDTGSLSSNSLSLIILARRTVPPTWHSQSFLPQRHGYLKFKPISCSNSGPNTSNTDDDFASVPDPDQPPTATPPGAVGVRFRRRSRKQSRQQRDNGFASTSMQTAKTKVLETSPKKWEDMNLTEKATELYMGEKGLLFWLNKFAYASIFIMIGAWIAFRFVGPALNLYQLDSAPLPPSSIFKGSS